MLMISSSLLSLETACLERRSDLSWEVWFLKKKNWKGPRARTWGDQEGEPGRLWEANSGANRKGSCTVAGVTGAGRLGKPNLYLDIGARWELRHDSRLQSVAAIPPYFSGMTFSLLLVSIYPVPFSSSEPVDSHLKETIYR